MDTNPLCRQTARQRVTLRRGPHTPEPTAAIVRRGEDVWGGEAAGPAAVDCATVKLGR
ncbi:MAG: hypothetical protein HYT88_04790 [Candidatus Omnitrophica bacterium]|nr:hypothetical protein [Candidatus Omnitrophota bacterium]